MLKIIICWNRHNMAGHMDRLVRDHYQINDSGSTATKNDIRIRIITQLQTNNILSALNPDEVHFELIPDQDELDLAISRTKAKEGKTYIQGRKVHDHKGNQEEPQD